MQNGMYTDDEISKLTPEQRQAEISRMQAILAQQQPSATNKFASVGAGALGGFLRGLTGQAPAATTSMTMNPLQEAQLKGLVAENIRQNDPLYQEHMKAAKAATAEKENPLGISDKDKTILTGIQNNEPGYDPKKIVDQLDPGTKDIVDGIRNYEIDPRSIRGMKAGPMVYALLKIVKTVDPSYDEKEYNSRQDFLTKWKSKDLGNANIAAKQTVRHLGELKDSVNSLQNTGSPIINAPYQAWQQKFAGRPEVTDVVTNITAVNEELTKAWAGNNNGLERVREWQQSLNKVNSPQQWDAAISKATKLLDDAIKSRQSYYKAAMGRESPSVLDPEEQGIMDNLKGLYSPKGGNTNQESSTVPSIGGNFNGEKVLKVTRL